MLTKRLFLKTALSSLAVSPGILTVSAHSSLHKENSLTYFFYDDRFSEAHKLAAEFAAPTRPTPVQGDVTPLWTDELNSLSRWSPLTLYGVTTESFHFCLKTLLRSQASVKSEIQRLSKDLYTWDIQTKPFRRSRTTSL
jgi:hypothetical protein